MPVVLGVATGVTAVCLSAAHDEKPMMKAVVAHEYGRTEVLKFEELPRPEPKKTKRSLRGSRSSVNPE